MNARLLLVFSVHVLITYWVQRTVSVTVNVDGETEPIISKSKVELTPILITSGLNDIVILSAPIVDAEAIYYLHRPNGDAIQLNFKENKTDTRTLSHPNDLKAKYSVEDRKQNFQNYRIFNVNRNETCRDTEIFAKEETKMAPYDFIIGPLQEDDHGNWVLSAFYMDVDGNWIELFQVITIEIIETVPLSPEKYQLGVGDKYSLRFAYPIPDLQSCQVKPPSSTFDRIYERHRTDLDVCEFIMRNVTLKDQGTWSIIGVGRIVYKGSAYLKVVGKNTQATRILNTNLDSTFKVRIKY